jgi:hypothetical protein
MFKQVKDEIGKPNPTQSDVALLEWIMTLGLACAIETDADTFYLVEIGASLGSKIEPSELMMAFRPTGIICYFSAVSLHSLTSQMPTHHHLAILTKPDPLAGDPARPQEVAIDRSPEQSAVQAPEASTEVRSKPNPLGRAAFSYEGIPFYLTTRSRRLLPGVQERTNGPRGRFRITTLEQTLLDTLHKPQNCGGPAVVLEAWQEAVASERLDEERLVAYLTQMDYPSTTRRLGAMLHRLEYTPGDELGGYLTQAKESIDRSSAYSQISLLPGFKYSTVDEDWRVCLP